MVHSCPGNAAPGPAVRGVAGGADGPGHAAVVVGWDGGKRLTATSLAAADTQGDAKDADTTAEKVPKCGSLPVEPPAPGTWATGSEAGTPPTGDITRNSAASSGAETQGLQPALSRWASLPRPPPADHS